ncbi:hypothetical protein [Paludisphaera soli]|uniref:hypothetical protein n=1 Tax=Paludisphaera soli TaxID=2712865 RepID=UPI0013ED7949|nr:hypothetical protein [Paludisphaera soli]
MNGFDWRGLTLDDGVVLESVGEDGRVVLWVRLDQEAAYQYWDRVGTAHRGEVRVERGVCWTTATAVRTRRRASEGLLARLVGAIAARRSDSTWRMPDGGKAERCGGRRADLALAWAEDGSGPLDDRRLREVWSADVLLRRLGDRLVLASGLGPATDAGTNPDVDAGTEDQAATAARLLDAARRRGDRRGEAAALADLGVLRGKAGDADGAVELLEQALRAGREAGDRAREAEVLVDLGHIQAARGLAEDSRRSLASAFSLAEGLDDGSAKTAVLERIAELRAKYGDPDGAATALDRAGEAARAAGDPRHEARIHWRRAIAAAESGRPDLAAARAEASIALLRSIGRPEASWYEAQANRYREGAAIDPAHAADGEDGPGVLRMAQSAGRAMALFLGSGMRTTTTDSYRDRLAKCRTCPHHTGIRCRVCGCFTNVKARLPYERCPIGEW